MVPHFVMLPSGCSIRSGCRPGGTVNSGSNGTRERGRQARWPGCRARKACMPMPCILVRHAGLCWLAPQLCWAPCPPATACNVGRVDRMPLHSVPTSERGTGSSAAGALAQLPISFSAATGWATQWVEEAGRAKDGGVPRTPPPATFRPTWLLIQPSGCIPYALWSPPGGSGAVNINPPRQPTSTQCHKQRVVQRCT